MPTPYLRPLNTIGSVNNIIYPALWSVLNDLSQTRIARPTSTIDSDYSVDLLVPDDGSSVRNLKKECSYRRITLYPSDKNRRMINCESYIERKFVHLLEFHPEIVSFREQPCIIYWLDSNGKSRKHIPDFRIEFRNGNVVIAEVKPDSAVNDLDISQRTKLLNQAIPTKYGFQYLLVVESQLDGTELMNADMIRKFPKVNHSLHEFEHVRTVFESENTSLCLDDFKNMPKLACSEKFIETVKSLIRIGVVIFDMTEAFDNKTPLKWIDR